MNEAQKTAVGNADAAVTAAYDAMKAAIAALEVLADLGGEAQRRADLALEDAIDAFRSVGDCSRQISHVANDLE